MSMKKKFNHKRFLLQWFLAGIAVFPLAYAIFLLITIGLEAAITNFIPLAIYHGWFEVPLFVIISCSVTGFCIGILQKTIIRRQFGIDLRRWILFSVCGALLVGLITVLLIIYGLRQNTECCSIFNSSDWLTYPLGMMILLGVFSAIQMSVLRNYVRDAWLWIAAHLASIPITWVILLAALIIWRDTSFAYELMWLQIVALPTIALVTGKVMWRLQIQNLHTGKLKRDQPTF